MIPFGASMKPGAFVQGHCCMAVNHWLLRAAQHKSTPYHAVFAIYALQRC